MSYISTYLQRQRQLLEESVTRFLTEGKHWPQDYLRTSFDKLKSRFPGTPDEDIKKAIVKVQKDIESIPAAHEGTWIQWHPKWWSILDFIALKAGEELQTFDEVKNLIDGTLPKIIKGLPVLDASSNPECSPAMIKTKSFEDFLNVIDRAVAASREVNAGQNGSEYEVVPISSWEQMNRLYGRKTGLKGNGEWCHTHDEYVWTSWTQNGSKAFFVIQRKDWEDIKAPDPETTSSAFDDYGMSLIAILVDIMTGDLLRETLRWNHKKAPPMGESYVDHAFDDSWKKLDKAVGLDVKSICDQHIAEVRQKLEQMRADPDGFVQQQMQNATEIDAETVPAECRQYVKHIVIPDSVETIGDNTFFNCMNLTSIVIPDSVETIGDNTFFNCMNLTSIVIPDSVKSIGRSAFNNCTSLKSISIPDSVTSIGEWAFSGCSSLKGITIPDSAISIGRSAFSDCISLKSISIPGSAISIERSAFSHCSSLKSIVIPDSVISIERGAFYDCESLTSIVIPDSVKSIGENAFSNCTSLTSIAIPGSVENIGECAFWYCLRLTSIDIPDSVESIGSSTFCGCKSLTSIVIPDSVKSIGKDAFNWCESLTSIVIPGSVASIREDAFLWCRILKRIVFKDKTLDEIKSMDNYPWGIDIDNTEIIAEFE